MEIKEEKENRPNENQRKSNDQVEKRKENQNKVKPLKIKEKT